MNPNFRGPCGWCSKCKSGHKSECYFPRPVNEDGSIVKSFSDLSATSISNVAVPQTTTTTKTSEVIERCYKSHPALKITDAVTIFGGSASDPVAGCDIYVALDRYADTMQAYPWDTNGVISFVYPITDMSAPKNTESFVKMIAWLKGQALAGKKIHVGCMSGHGRTGMVLAALVKEVSGEADAIKFVRDHYCKRAVEATEQVKFLHKQFGIKEQKGSKSWGTTGGSYSAKDSIMHGPGYSKKYNDKFKNSSDDSAYPVTPMDCSYNVWGV